MCNCASSWRGRLPNIFQRSKDRNITPASQCPFSFVELSDLHKKTKDPILLDQMKNYAKDCTKHQAKIHELKQRVLQAKTG